MNRMGGDAEMESRGGGRVESHMYMRSDATGTQAGGAGGFADDGEKDGLRDRAARLAGRARNAVGGTIGRAGGALSHPTDLVSAVRSRPLTSVGLAFSLGFLIAAGTGSRNRNWVIEKGRRQLRSALIGGLTATLAHELRTMIGSEEGIGGLVESFLGEDLDDEGLALDELDDPEDEDEYS